MDVGTQIGLSVLVLGALTLAYRLYTFIVAERRNKAAERQARIERVSDEYRELAENITASGFDGLQKAGVATLKNDEEIRDLADRIVEYGVWDPLTPRDLLDGVDLNKLFDIAAKERVNWSSPGADVGAFIQKHNLK